MDARLLISFECPRLSTLRRGFGFRVCRVWGVGFKAFMCSGLELQSLDPYTLYTSLIRSPYHPFEGKWPKVCWKQASAISAEHMSNSKSPGTWGFLAVMFSCWRCSMGAQAMIPLEVRQKSRAKTWGGQ